MKHINRERLPNQSVSILVNVPVMTPHRVWSMIDWGSQALGGGGHVGEKEGRGGNFKEGIEIRGRGKCRYE